MLNQAALDMQAGSGLSVSARGARRVCRYLLKRHRPCCQSAPGLERSRRDENDTRCRIHESALHHHCVSHRDDQRADALVTTSGLAPGLVGLCQVDALLPAEAPGASLYQQYVCSGRRRSGPAAFAGLTVICCDECWAYTCLYWLSKD